MHVAKTTTYVNWKQKLVLAVTFCFMAFSSAGQCPTLFDFFGNPEANPYWFDCLGAPTGANLTIQSPDNIGAWTIDWGRRIAH